MAHVNTAQQIEQFKKIAPAIVENAKARVTSAMEFDEVMQAIHEEILNFFVKQQQIAVEYMAFTDVQRAQFSNLIYTLIEPLSGEFKGKENPKYSAYVAATGKTGALNFMVNA